ncbi:hypothetical protein YSY43_13620 [Paenibacillus sp. YSY-4.3]
MGPSGAGKSTLLNIFSTIDTPTSGEITIDGQNIVAMNEEKLSDFRRNKLGFIFQDYNLLDTLTVKENILLPLALSADRYHSDLQVYGKRTDVDRFYRGKEGKRGTLQLFDWL